MFQSKIYDLGTTGKHGFHMQFANGLKLQELTQGPERLCFKNCLLTEDTDA